MDYTSIHIYGHLLSDDILHEIETDSSMQGNREQDFNLDVSLTGKIDNAWSSLRNDWKLFAERNLLRDTYGTKSVRRLMERFFASLDYQLNYQQSQIEISDRKFDIPYLCPDLEDMPIIIVGDKTGDVNLDTLDKCTLDIRQKGERRQKSPHATMLDYLNNTEHVYGIVTNGQVLRIIRNTGQLVKLTYIEFDLRRMVEEDHYAEFCLLFRLMHSSRFTHTGDETCILERWFNMSIESGNRIRAGLSDAVQRTMEILGRAVVCGDGTGNECFRQAVMNGEANAQTLNKELIHFIYRLLFLFIIEDRNLVYNLKESDPDYDQIVRCQDIYKRYYAISRLRGLSELLHLRNELYHDLWDGLMESFRLFEDEEFGANMFIKPLGGVLFAPTALKYLRQCQINNRVLLEAFACLNEFVDERQNRVKINYSSLDVEEFGSVYEGILEMRAVIIQGASRGQWNFTFGSGLDRQSTSSYYTRPDLVQNLIRTTLEPVIKERIGKLRTPEEKVKSLLSMKVCDAASGSGHIILAMARTIAWYVCSIRTGEDNPASLDYREALREVIQKCVYAVDYNPDAVELCKVVLWIEGYCAGKPLSFLDHHIRCGNSVVGITNLDTLLDGVPKEAFCVAPITTEATAKANADKEKEVLKKIRQINKEAIDEIHGTTTLFKTDFKIEQIDSEQVGLANSVKEISELPENSLLEELTKQKRWEDLMASPRVESLRRACDIYTYAYYHQFTPEDLEGDYVDTSYVLPNIPYTRTVYQALEEIKQLEHPTNDYKPLSDEFKQKVTLAAKQQSFFHWCIEFPEVFAYDGGFDVMCGNPPWDKIKVEDKKWFDSHGRADIVNAGTAALRKRMIEGLQNSDPCLYNDYIQAQKNAESMSRFLRISGRFPLTASGDIDLYPLFAEHCLCCSKEAWGLVMPTGIATNDSNKNFFAKLIEENRLMSLYDFENKEALFDIHRMFKFCLLTAGKAQSTPRSVNGGFYLTRLDHLLDPNRIYKLNSNVFAILNPNTKTCPVFRTSKDAELTAKIYKQHPVIWNEITKNNIWNIKFGCLFHMSADSDLFNTYQQLLNRGAVFNENGNFVLDSIHYLPMYEGKMIWLYNHHFGTWPTEGTRPNVTNTPSDIELSNPDSLITPWYWIDERELESKMIKKDNQNRILWEWKHSWFLAFRDITNSTNERTFVSSIIPRVAVGARAPLIYIDNIIESSLFLGMVNSLVFDYISRQKVGGSNMGLFFVKQFPTLIPQELKSAKQYCQIIERVAKLTYFNHDLDGWAEELWEELTPEQQLEIPQLGNKEPFVYDSEQRAVWQAELDAIFAHLYGLSTEDVKYILDPEDVCGVGCINETFRVLKDSEIREFGEYRTKRLVMKAWYSFGYDN